MNKRIYDLHVTLNDEELQRFNKLKEKLNKKYSIQEFKLNLKSSEVLRFCVSIACEQEQIE